MLKRLRLSNFQKHKKLDILFEPITTIVGRTDAGKSALYRALKFLALNDLRGDAFIRKGATSSAVSIQFKNSPKISRKKGKALNEYSVGSEEFKAFGSNVPEGVQKALRLGEFNFQSQHDAPFWLSLSAGEAGRRLNDLVDLDIISKSFQKLSSLMRENKTEITVLERSILRERQIASDNKEARDWLKRFKRIEKDLRKNAEDQDEFERQQEIYLKAQRFRKPKPPPKIDTEALEKASEDLAELIRNHKSKQGLALRLKRASEDVQQATEALELVEREFHNNTKNKPCPLCGKTM